MPKVKNSIQAVQQTNLLLLWLPFRPPLFSVLHHPHLFLLTQTEGLAPPPVSQVKISLPLSALLLLAPERLCPLFLLACRIRTAKVQAQSEPPDLELAPPLPLLLVYQLSQLRRVGNQIRILLVL